MVNKIYNILFIIILFTNLHSQDSTRIYNLEESIVVTASRVTTTLPNVRRSVSIISQNEIRTAPVQTIPELLQYIASVDLQQRGPAGAQADISIRGATFEQTSILIDGIQINDPQTGHNLANIPLTLADIDRVEILKGPGSRLHGANAFGGLINIITKTQASRGVAVSLEGGKYQLFNGSIYTALPFLQMSFSKNSHSGYRYNSDLNSYSANIKSAFSTDNITGSVLLGFSDKEFGANGFYSTRFPDQWEKIKTTIAHARLIYNNSGFKINPVIRWRRTNDLFRLKRQNPAFYQNNHKTDSYGVELNNQFRSRFGITSFGGEWSKETINSNNLGNRERERTSLYLDQQSEISKTFIANVGLYAYRHSSFAWKLLPGIELGVNLSSHNQLFLSVNQGFRIPTYTELYYTDPVNQGNPQLESEENISYEIGYKHFNSNWLFSTSVFNRQSKNLIDWILNSADQIWYAENISEMNTLGFEAGIEYDPNIDLIVLDDLSFKLDYTFLESTYNNFNLISRYSLNYLRQQVGLRFSYDYTLPGLSHSWYMRYNDRITQSDYFLTDTKISYKIEAFKIDLSVTNLFNQSYEEIPSVPLPGRWIKLGLHLNLLTQ